MRKFKVGDVVEWEKGERIGLDVDFKGQRCRVIGFIDYSDSYMVTMISGNLKGQTARVGLSHGFLVNMMNRNGANEKI